MAGKVITAEARITASDKTGSVFDKIAAKIKGVEKTAKALQGVKAPRFVGDFNDELARLKLSEKELQSVRKSMGDLQRQLKSSPIQAAHYFRAIDDWKSKTVAHWREVKSAVNEADVAHRRFFRGAGALALRGGAMLGGAYAAQRTARAGITAAATGAREGARDYLAGLSDEDSKRLSGAAFRSSAEYPSVDANSMHERLRDTAMSTRSMEKAIELSDTIAQGTTVLQSLKGKDKAIEEGRKFFSALDTLGKNVETGQIRELWNGYIKAMGVEGADMNLAGVLAMARQSKSAGGMLSPRFMMTTGIGLQRDMGDHQVGTSLGSMLSQVVGGRATKKSKETQVEYGLRDAKTQRYLDEEKLMRDPDLYAWENLKPALIKKKIDIENEALVSGALSKLYSNQSVANILTKLITQETQYRAKGGGDIGGYNRTPDIDKSAKELLKRDPFVAYEAVLAQLRNLSTQAPIMDAAAAGLNSLTGAIANLNKFVETGKVPEDSRGGRWLKEFNAPVAQLNERRRLENLEAQSREIDQKLQDGGLDQNAKGRLRLRQFEIQSGLAASRNHAGMGPVFSDAEIAKLTDEADERRREHNRGRFGGMKGIPLPAADPRGRSDMPPVQSLEGANIQTTVTGEVATTFDGTFTVVPGSALIALEESVKKMLVTVQAKLSSIGSNGPGSTGLSSPDAAAPHVGSSGNMPM